VRFLLSGLILSSFLVSSCAQQNALFPFVLPWDDSSPSFTNISDWHHKPAGKYGHIKVKADGHLYAGNERIRFFGVNLCFGGAFPRKEDAEKIAARMAKFGINIVRFHHMDSGTFPDGIRARGRADTRGLDPESLDRLDYLIYQLKKNGIYVNLNLLVSRPFNSADGLPKEIETLDWKLRHSVGFFYEPLLNLQKEYARELLTHRNPYTQTTYAEEPCVAFVEIQNENGLIQTWLGGGIDRLPSVFLQELQRQWNDYLKKKYRTTASLKKAWKVKEEPLGEEILKNADFSQGLDNWVLEQHGGTRAIPELTNEAPPSFTGKSLSIKVEKGSDVRWYVQFHQPNLKVEANKPYTVSFWAKADREREITLVVSQAHEPWENLGFAVSLNLDENWKRFSFTFQLRQGDENARLCFTSLSQEGATFHLAGISLRPGGLVGLRENERIEDGSVPIFLRSRFGERTAEAQNDWLNFLWEKEDNYWQTMYKYLKNELGVKAIIIGTIVGCSTPNIMAKLDCVDTHSYWQHPIFPSRPWDPEDWLVPNLTMVNERGGTLPGLALKRVLGKPHSVTEYNHPAPNTYSSEGFLLLSAYAGLQDWDAIYAFSYSHRRDDWDRRMIPNFFDIDQHPTKMVTLIPSVAMFVRGDVKPANKLVVVEIDKKKEIEVLKRSWAWALVDAGFVGVPGEAMLLHRVAIATEGKKGPSGALTPDKLKIEGNRFVSDTGELVWDLSEAGRGLVTVNTPRSKAVIGYAGGKRIELGDVVIESRESLQNGWCAITITAMKGEIGGKGTADLLITATGYAENTDMGWKNPEKSSCGRNWGKPPSLVEGIPARITLPYSADRVEAWALDEKGNRKEKIEVGKDEKGNAVIEIGERWRTLWYEVAVK